MTTHFVAALPTSASLIGVPAALRSGGRLEQQRWSSLLAAIATSFAPIPDSRRVMHWLVIALSVGLSIGVLASAVDLQRGAAAEAADPEALAAARASSAIDTYGRLPMTFEQNAGQADASARFLARGAGYTVLLTEREVILALLPDAETGHGTIVRMMTIGGAAQPSISGVDPLPGRVNYLTGDDPSAWRTDLPTYGGVRYSDVYPGIDVVYYGNQRQLEYDFVVAPGADPTSIRLAFDGADRLRLADGGDLVLEIDDRELVQRAPVVYQEVAGGRQTIPGRYVLEEGEVTFSLGAYDHSLPLVIDPVIAYSTYLGGTSHEIAHGIAVDSSGNAYLAGETTSSDFPTVGAAQRSHGGDWDAFVVKLNPGGTALVYATYLGGSGSDYAEDIAIDGSGNAYVAGVTSSADFPTVNPFLDAFPRGTEDAFVAKLNPAGSALTYSSYLGAVGDDAANAIAVDGAGNAYVTGFTDSVAFPKVNPIQATKGATLDAFVTKVNAAGSAIVYSTYLGGNVDDLGHGIAVDGSGAAYVAGETISSNFPTQSPMQAAGGGQFDAFVTKVNPAGSALTYSTYLGGAGSDGARDIALDAAGNAYVTGITGSTNFPTTNALDASRGGLEDAFVTKINAAGSARVYSTYLGGSTADAGLSGLEEGLGIAVDATGAAHVTGWTQSNNFPLVNASQPTRGSFQDAFVAKVNPAGSALQHSSYLGGAGDNEKGQAIAIHSSGAAYLTGRTDSADFPTTAGAFDRTLPSQFQSSAFVTRLTYEAPAPPTVSMGPDLRLAEGSPSGTTNFDFTVSLAWAHTQPVTVRYTTSAGTTNPASAGSDYAAVTGGTVTIPAGQTSGIARVLVTRDATDELDETFRVTLSDPTNTTIAGDGLAIGTIANDDDPALSIADLALAEGHSGTTSFPFAVSLSAPSLQPVTVRYSTSAGITSPATAGSDYTTVSGALLTIPAGALSVTAPVSVIGDTLGETNETFRVTLFGQTNATLADGQAVGTISNDDGAPPPTVSMGPDLRLPEGSPSGTTSFDFTVSLSAASTQPVTVKYSTSAGTTNPATAGSDYTAVAGGTVTIPAGQTSGIARVVVNRDAADELDETFRVTLSAPTNATLAGDGLAIGTILNDDNPTLRIADLALAEGHSGTTSFPFAVTLSSASREPVTVRYSTSAGVTSPATAGSDYTTVTGVLLTIPAGALSVNAPVSVTGDTLGEANETFRVTLFAPANATLADPQAVGTINNDDGAVLPTLSMGPDLNLAEGSPTATASTTNFDFRITLSAASAQPVTVKYSTSVGTTNPATAGSDYAAVTNATVTIPAGQTSGIARVVVNRDAADELDETFKVTLSNPTNATLAGDGLAIGTIRNDDNPALRIADLTRAEGNSGTTSFIFAVSLSAVSLEPVTVKYTTSAGTTNPATVGTDYTAVTAASLTIPAGALTVNAPVSVTGDTQIEPNETFRVSLSGALNATIADGLAIGTITTDDPDPTPPTVGAPTTDFLANLSLAATTTPIPIRVSFTATDPSGIASTNLQQKVGTAAFADIALAPANATTKDLFLAPSDTTTRQFRARATDAATPPNTSPFSTGPVLRIRALQDGSTSVAQSGAWTSVSNVNHYGGTVRHTGVAGSKQSITAVMTDFAFVSTKANDRGMAKIFIDGIEVATIDLYSASTQYRRVVYQFSFTGPATTHTVELRVLGTKNAASSGTRVDLDAFLLITP